MRRSSDASRCLGLLLPVLATAACARSSTTTPASAGTAAGTGAAASAVASADMAARGAPERVRRGRQLVIEHGCGDCHGGGSNPESPGWLAGLMAPAGPLQEFKIGPCYLTPGAQPCWTTRSRNITPHNTTGMGRFSERQIFNALRYGLRPGETPDVEITSTTPGQGNFPANPKYLAPPMPWPSWRHLPDEDLWAIAAYLKRGVKPMMNRVQDSEGPPDFWAGEYTVGKIGPYPARAFPTDKEQAPAGGAASDQVLRGRHMVVHHACGDCHGGGSDPSAQGWLAGMTSPMQEFRVGACAEDPTATPCFRFRPRNLTPDVATGTGRYSERQIFNALRYGLRPSETPDVTITSTVPGQGNFPANPKYLAPGMPWPAWRHMPDADLWAIAAYLKRGLKPVSNRVADSDAPPDFWAGEFTVEKIGPFPARPFPTANEVAPR